MNDVLTRANRRELPADLLIERSGGLFGHGLLAGASLISRGPADGHDFWIDQELLAAIAAALMDATSGADGIKSRYTHPFASADSLGRYLGRVTALDEQTTARALAAGWVPCDVNLAKSAHRTPEGDLASYIMDRGEEDPAALGLSAVFKRDFQAELEFMLAHGGQIEPGPDGQDIVVGFVSPDPKNRNNLPHARLAELRAADLVGDPAANPGGLRGPVSGLSVNDEFWRYALGLTDQPPPLAALDVDPGRLRSHLAAFFERNRIQLKEVSDMTTPSTPAALSDDPAAAAVEPPQQAVAPDTTPAAPPATTETPQAASEPAADDPLPPDPDPAADEPAEVDGGTVETPPAAEAGGQADTSSAPATPPAAETVNLSAGDLQRWQALGPNALTWLAEGLTIEQAQAKLITQQQAELAQLRQTADAARGERDPVSGNTPQAAGDQQPSEETALGRPDGTAGFAQELDQKIQALQKK